MRHGWPSGDKPDTPLVWVGVLIPTLKFMFLDMSPMAGIFSPVTFFFITPNLHSQWSLLKTTINTNNSHDQQCIPNAKKMQSICILDLSLTPLIMFTNQFTLIGNMPFGLLIRSTITSLRLLILIIFLSLLIFSLALLILSRALLIRSRSLLIRSRSLLILFLDLLFRSRSLLIRSHSLLIRSRSLPILSRS